MYPDIIPIPALLTKNRNIRDWQYHQMIDGHSQVNRQCHSQPIIDTTQTYKFLLSIKELYIYMYLLKVKCVCSHQLAGMIFKWDSIITAIRQNAKDFETMHTPKVCITCLYCLDIFCRVYTNLCPYLRSWWGVYWIHLVHVSVHLSVCPSIHL